MKTLDVNTPGITLFESVRRMGDAPLALLAKGRPVAVLVPVGDADLETISLSFSPRFQQLLEESRRSYYQKGGIPAEEVRRLFASDSDKKNGAKKQPRRKKRTAAK